MTTTDQPRSMASLANHQLVLYGRALHPDSFQLRARRVFKRGHYELEVWLVQGLHALRFSHDRLCVTELLTDQLRVPATGIVSGFVCTGEREYEHRFESGRTVYMTSVQTETLSETLYADTYDEIFDTWRRSPSALVSRWDEDAGRCMSVIDVQQMSREVHAECYHLLAGSGLVIRTQTIFEER